MSFKKTSSSIGYVQGPNGEDTLVCQFFHMVNSQGRMWYGGDPFAYTVPVMLMQLTVISAITTIVWFLLRPWKQSLVSAQLIGGIIMGRSFLGHIEIYGEKLFPAGGRQILETSADLGFMFYLFILGVHIDFSLVKKIEKYSVVIGLASFLVPLTIGLTTVVVISRNVNLEFQALPFVGSLGAISSFPVITSLLMDLNILNSEIGRLATLSALVCDICNYTIYVLAATIDMYLVSQQFTIVWSVLGSFLFYLVIIFGLCPIVKMVAGRLSDGQQMREAHFVVITLVVLVCGLGTEVMGQPPVLGTFLLGMVVPDGPPLGSSYVNKLDTITTRLLVPAKFVISGLNMDIFSIGGVSGAAIAFVIFVGYVAKFAGVFVASLYYKIPTKEAVTLALIMCCRGAIEAALYITLYEDEIIGSEEYALLLTSMLLVTGIARPLIAHLYDPSSTYVGQCRNSVMLNHPTDELRILVCIHSADNVPTIINLLEATTPMKDRPLAVFALSLMELCGHGAAVLESTNRRSRLTSTKSWSKQAANAFNAFAQRNVGSVVIRHFTSIAPYASMHDDVCTLAADQVTNIVIIPFHKQWTIDGAIGSSSRSIRMVNQNVMAKAPCSVGILVDRGQVGANQFVLKGNPMFRICLLFLGGIDDCEALAYCTRFIENQEISLMFVWIRELDHAKYSEENGPTMEIEMVNQFRARTIGDERIVYKEEVVKDAIGTTRVINSVKEYGCDLCVVGRYHDPDSPLLFGLNEWSECPELGLIGDVLATSDFQFSVLVVQQEPQGGAFTFSGADKDSLQPIGCNYLSSARYSDLLDDHYSSYSFPRV